MLGVQPKPFSTVITHDKIFTSVKKKYLEGASPSCCHGFAFVCEGRELQEVSCNRRPLTILCRNSFVSHPKKRWNL